MDTNRVVYNRESVQKSLELLQESDNEFRNAGVDLRTALEILKEIKGIKTFSKVEALSDDNTPQNLMTMCDENIGNTIYNINNGIEKMEDYITNNKDLDLRQLSGVSAPAGQGQTAPSQPSAPSSQFGNQPTGPNGEQPPSPPSGPGEGQGQTGPNGEQPPSPPSGPGEGQGQTGPNGKQPPSPPSGPGEGQGQTGPNGEQPPSPPSGPGEGQGQTGPNGEQPPSPPEEPTPPEGATKPSQGDMKKGSLLGALIGLGVGATAVGGTTAAVIHSKKKKNKEDELDSETNFNSSLIKIEKNETLDED